MHAMPLRVWIGRNRWAVAAFLGVITPILIGQIAAFPCMDDGWLSLLVRESGRAAVRASIHRRVMAELLYAASWSPLTFKVAGVGFSILLWSVMAIQTGLLWTRLFPGREQFRIAAACLSVAPVLVETQLTTLVTTIPINLPVALGYAALLLVWRYAESGRTRQLVLACLATVSGFVVSEYAAAPLLVCFVFLAMFYVTSANSTVRGRSMLAAGGLLLSALVGYAVFHSVANYSYDPRLKVYTPAGAVAAMLSNPLDLAVWIPNTIWRAAIGGLSGAFASLSFSWGEKSTLAAALYGCLLGTVLVFACGRTGRAQSRSGARTRILFLLAALIVSLLPEYARQGIFFVGRHFQVEPYSTRFYSTALPVAACFTTWILLGLARARAQFVVVFLLGLLIGDSLFLEVYGEYRKQRYEYALGPLLRPYVESYPGLTVAVMPDYLGREYEIIYKAAAAWPPELSKRLLILYEDRMSVLFQRRPERSGACENLRTVQTMIGPSVYREGEARLLWVDEHKDETFNVEPYCVPSLLPQDPSREPMVIRTPASSPLPPL